MLRMPWWRYVRRAFDGFFVQRWCIIVRSTVAISGSIYAWITALIARWDGRASVGGTDSDGYVCRSRVFTCTGSSIMRSAAAGIRVCLSSLLFLLQLQRHGEVGVMLLLNLLWRYRRG